MFSQSDKFEKELVMRNLYKHMEYLSVTIGDRHLWEEFSLDKTAYYIEPVLENYGHPVQRQTYSCYGKAVSNLIAKKNGTDGKVVIIGNDFDET